MGKKDKKKKGFGVEKTTAKTDRKLVAKQKKLLQKLGEDDIESIVANLQKSDAKDTTETISAPPSPRSNVSICSLDDLIYFFGGEFFNGSKTEVFGDFMSFNVIKNEWKSIHASPCPAPRSAHQMISTQQNGGELYLFGGEYASTSGLQFYHFKDLWRYQLVTKKWEKINSPGGPSARSGHRMVLHKKKIILFGGFHDNNQTFHYYNDVYLFSLETYNWTKLDMLGTPPAARSGVGIGVCGDDKIIIFGGYTKTSGKKGAEHGMTHPDAFTLQEADGKWKWNQIKLGGRRPVPRSGVAFTIANGRIYTFGGVLDTEEDDVNLRGQFSNEIHFLDTTGGGLTWRKVELKKKKDESQMAVTSSSLPSDIKTTTDGIFTVTVAGPKSQESSTTNTSQLDVGGPSPRMNASIVIVRNQLYIFGGAYEQGSRQYTLCDFYSIDVNKLDSWKTYIGNLPSLQWFGSDSEDSSSDSEKDDDDESDSDDSSEMDTE